MKDNKGKLIKLGDIIVVAGGYFVVITELNRHLLQKNLSEFKFKLIFDYDRSVKENEYEYEENVAGREAKERRVIGNIKVDNLKEVMHKYHDEEMKRIAWNTIESNSIIPIFKPAKV